MFETVSIIELKSSGELKDTIENVPHGYITCVYILNDMYDITDIINGINASYSTASRHITYFKFIYKLLIDNANFKGLIIDNRSGTPQGIKLDEYTSIPSMLRNL